MVHKSVLRLSPRHVVPSTFAPRKTARQFWAPLFRRSNSQILDMHFQICSLLEGVAEFDRVSFCDLRMNALTLTKRDVGDSYTLVTLAVSVSTLSTYTLLKVNVEISTFRGRSQGLPRGRNISSSIKGRIVLPR